MSTLDSLVTRTYAVDSQYFGVNLVSSATSSATAQVLAAAGPNAARGSGQHLTITSVNDATNQITFAVSANGYDVGPFTEYVVGYDASTGSILFDPLPSNILALATSAAALATLSSASGILSTDLSPGATILFPALSASTVVTATPITNVGSGPGDAKTPVYRFFDSTFGTHLFTQSLSEAQQILPSRPDLTEETNNFGAVSPSNPSAESIYRFFETSNGTHFFTASHAEFLGLTTPGTSNYRPDLTYESSSTFYEDSIQQLGDVAVYRLFDSAHGTQFLTGSQLEYQSLTTPGSGGYRSDLSPEGIAFYAPAGTSHT